MRADTFCSTDLEYPGKKASTLHPTPG